MRTTIASLGVLLALHGQAAGQDNPSTPPAGHVHQAPAGAADAPREPPQPAGAGAELPPSIPPVTDEDRKAAFPEAGGHLHNDNGIYSLVLVDRLEWQAGRAVDVDVHGWFGRDRDRVWFRVEGDSERGRLDSGRAHVLYGRQVSRWWDIVAGIRHDVRPGPAQTWVAFGIQGLAPYWFDIEATAYVGAASRLQARVKAEYELLVTNRLILQPLVQVDLAGRSDPRRGVGAGLNTTEVGIRLRYEIKRELAPYVGATWTRAWGKTAGFARSGDGGGGGPRLVVGARVWF